MAANRSKVKDLRFWDRWRESGAVTSIYHPAVEYAGRLITITQTASDMVAQAKNQGRAVSTWFNDLRLVATPDANPADLVEHYHRYCER